MDIDIGVNCTWTYEVFLHITQAKGLKVGQVITKNRIDGEKSDNREDILAP